MQTLQLYSVQLWTIFAGTFTESEMDNCITYTVPPTPEQVVVGGILWI